ncbi:TlpA family protein disulfide reductase [Sphingobacterium siyangense]|uniref:TlpA family protein disulfide reductase n=1 Tax=Sphingobacterium siyangense TaxID=459529 RepID=UPI003C74FA2D
MKNRLLYIYIIALICNVFVAGAQPNFKVDLKKRLLVGDTFIAPDNVSLIRGNLKRIDWKKLKNKVVLLDFFDTYCASCIQLMPHLQDLQNTYGDKIQIITVTWQNRETMGKFFAQNQYLSDHKVNLPVIYNDTYLKDLFPHQSVPHEVLIYQGRVQAITGPNYITAENLLKLHKENQINLPLRDEYGKADLKGQIKSASTNFKAGTLISGFQEGIPYQSWRMESDSTNGLYKSSVYNTSIYSALLGLAAKAKLKKKMYVPRMDRVIWQVKDSSKFYDFEQSDPFWETKNSICYERYDPIIRPDSVLADIILKDFISFCGVTIKPDVRKIKVLRLVSTKPQTESNPEPTDAVTYRGTAVFAGFTDMSMQFPPILDEVNSDVKLRIAPYNNLEELNKQLARYGIKAEYGLSEMDVLVIEEY